MPLTGTVTKDNTFETIEPLCLSHKIYMIIIDEKLNQLWFHVKIEKFLVKENLSEQLNQLWFWKIALALDDETIQSNVWFEKFVTQKIKLNTQKIKIDHLEWKTESTLTLINLM